MTELSPTPDAAVAEVVGKQRRRVMPGPIKLLQIISGYLLLRWIGVLFARHLLGYQVDSKLAYNGRHLHYTSQTVLMGREIRSVEEFILTRDLVSIGIERRYPHLLLLTGALGLIVGAMVGVGWVIDGIQASYVPIAMVGLGVLAIGILFDVALAALGDFVGDQESVLVAIKANNKLLGFFGRRFRIIGVPETGARAFISAVTHGR
ncbi:MAG: hypothetical protein ACI9OJ_000817 [Myxococcota bacterium]|jgi:hypothetical protein